MLALDDSRWKLLDHRGWANGVPYRLDPDAPFVPDELAYLLLTPQDATRFGQLWPYLCSEGTAWPASYAAAPYIVEIASRLAPAQRFEHLYVMGYIVMCTGSEANWPDHVPDYLLDSFRESVRRAVELLGETVQAPITTGEVRYLAAAVAALKGDASLGALINNLDSGCECPECGAQMDARGR